MVELQTDKPRPSEEPLIDRIGAIDWNRMADGLACDGLAVAPALLTVAECEMLSAYYPERERFRSRIVMERYAFGKGEYQYFSYPLPPIVAELRTSLYRRLAPIAKRLESAFAHQQTVSG